MARSTYIYVVMLGDEVLAVFTVKHELVTALRRHAEVWPRVVDAYHVHRYEDGAWLGLGQREFMGTGRDVLDASR
jgi:hypothetical protein